MRRGDEQSLVRVVTSNYAQRPLRGMLAMWARINGLSVREVKPATHVDTVVMTEGVIIMELLIGRPHEINKSMINTEMIG